MSAHGSFQPWLQLHGHISREIYVIGGCRHWPGADKLFTILGHPNWNPENNRRDNLLDNFSSRALVLAERIFRGFLCLGSRIFSRGFRRRILFPSFFVGESAQKSPPKKSPAKSSRICTTKIPDTFLQTGRAGRFECCKVPERSQHNQAVCARRPKSQGLPKVGLPNLKGAHDEAALRKEHRGTSKKIGPFWEVDVALLSCMRAGKSLRGYHSVHNHYSQLSYFWELIRITVTVTVTVIIFPGINYITVMSPLQL